MAAAMELLDLHEPKAVKAYHNILVRVNAGCPCFPCLSLLCFMLPPMCFFSWSVFRVPCVRFGCPA